MTKCKGSKRKAIDEGNTSKSKEPRTSTAEPGQEQLEEQPTAEAQQPQQEQIEEEQPAQAEEVDSPEETDAEDNTTKADDDGLKIRALPKILTTAVEQLNPAQRQAVKDIGLGSLLDLQITNFPRQMGLWLVENFDPRSCTLKLQNGQTIHITADDVAAVLGLPKGNIEITKRTVKAMPEILKEWRWFFEKTTAYITPKALKRKMLEVDVADPWFKRHFALLVMSVLVDPMVNGYVTQNYIDHLLEVGNIQNLNWSQLVINALINSKQVWMKSTDKLYGGPIVFLMVKLLPLPLKPLINNQSNPTINTLKHNMQIFYVDRVVFFRRIVPRSFPAIKSWTFKLLSKRERDEIKSGGFGYGHVDTALRLEDAPAPPEEGNPSIPVPDVPQPAQPPQHQQPQEDDAPLPEGLQVNTYLQTHSCNTRTIATGLLKVARLVENAPTAILEDDRFKKMFETARQLLGFKAQEDQHLTLSQQEDAFWSNPEFLNAVDEIVRAVQKRTYLNDIPSFSLGLTQDEQTQRWDDVNAVAREYNECEQSNEGEENQVANDGALGDETAEGRKGSEDRPNEGEGAQAREAATTAQADEVTPDEIQQGNASNPPEIPPKDQGKRPVVEYSPVRPRERLSIIDVNAPINATVDAIRKWVLENPNPDPAQELFRFESRVIHWSDMLSLKPNTELSTSIIDAWAAILNHNEEDQLSARLFASTWTTFLFPIIASQHYYLIHFDPLCERFDAIDNSSSVSQTEDKYGDVPKRLQQFLFMFLTGLKSTYKANKIQKLKLKRMKIGWRDNKNKIDCGVFLMRHMETFRGQLPEHWDCGLEKENKNQLNALRVKYLTALVMSDLNEHKAWNIQAAAEFGLEC
nr:uncharacterized protein LOC109155335 [Ipomoea batatas]